MKQFNVYDVNWHYIGYYWSSHDSERPIGEIEFRNFSGLLLNELTQKEIFINNRVWHKYIGTMSMQ